MNCFAIHSARAILTAAVVGLVSWIVACGVEAAKPAKTFGKPTCGKNDFYFCFLETKYF
jgi:hypothetical protein